MTTERERVISVSLSDAEWRAFVARHPHPVHWLRERILTEVAAPPPAGQPVSPDAHDAA